MMDTRDLSRSGICKELFFRSGNLEGGNQLKTQRSNLLGSRILRRYQMVFEEFPAAEAALAALARAGVLFFAPEATFIAAMMKISCKLKPCVVMYHICASQQTS